jgi:hypothetical protein
MSKRGILPEEALIQRMQALEERVKVLERVGSQGVTLQPVNLVPFAPSWSGTIGNGIITAKYGTFGDDLAFLSYFVYWGSTTSHGPSEEIFFRTPDGIILYEESPYQILTASILDKSANKRYNGNAYVGYYYDEVYTPDVTTIVRMSFGNNASFATPTNPLTLAVGDELYIEGVINAYSPLGT